MHITLVSTAFPHPKGGRKIGIERHTLEFARALHHEGHAIRIVTTFWNGGVPHETFEELEIVRLADSSYRWGILGRQFDFPYLSFTRSALRQEKLVDSTDVVHAISPIYLNEYLRKRGIPFVTHFHHRDRVRRAVELLKYPFMIPHQKKMYSSSDAVVTMTEYGRNLLIDYYGVPSDRIHVIPHGVDLERFEPSDSTSPKEMGQRVLFVGTLSGRKGVNYLVDAFSVVHSALPNARLILLGDGEDALRIRKQVAHLCLNDAVEFLGRVNDRELIRQYQAADLFVFPSLQEGFGIPLIEAMACGVPVVSTTATAIPDVVGDAGILVEPGRSDLLAGAILCVLQSDSRRTELVNTGLSRVRKHFNWIAVANRFVQLYNSLLVGNTGFVARSPE